MRNRIGLFAASFLALYVVGCSGDVGPAGPPGEQGKEGPSSDPSINAVIPGKVYLGRTVDVTISGFNTQWSDTTKVDFGDLIVVSNQIIASPTAIVATVDISPTAEAGARDVKVVDAAGTTTYKGAFKVEQPLTVTLQGTQAQGSILVASAKQLDLSTPFDPTTMGDGFIDPITYPNLSVDGAPGIGASIEDVQLYSVAMLLTVDINTAAGKSDVTVMSGPPGDQISSPALDAVDIVARTPQPLTEGTEVTGMVDVPLGTLLYSFTPPSAGFYMIETNTFEPNTNPNFATLPKSGKFAQLMAFGSVSKIEATNTDPFYFVYWDNSGASGYEMTMKATKIILADVEPNDTCAAAQPAGALPAKINNLALASANDTDWFSFDVMPGEEGKIVHVITSAGDAETDTVVEVFASNCTTSLGGPSSDNGYHENFKSTAITAAGKHFVRVKASTFGFTGKLYNLSIALETPPP